MIDKHSSGIYSSTVLSSLPHVIHGFSTRRHGNMMNSIENIKNFVFSISHASFQIFLPVQIHSDRTVVIPKESVKTDAVTCKKSGGKIAKVQTQNIFFQKDCDGIVARSTHIPHTILGVRGADCCMIMLVDPNAHIIGVIHSGWRGTVKRAVYHTVRTMESVGAHTHDIYAAIGPYIRSCCYDVSRERADMFARQFSGCQSYIEKREDRWFLDLGNINRYILMETGISDTHIDVSCSCTHCGDSELYSFRKGQTAPHHGMIGIISYQSDNI